MLETSHNARVPRRSKLIGAFRVLRMRFGQIVRRSPHPAPVGRPDYYKRELHSSLFVRSSAKLPLRSFVGPDHLEPAAIDVARKAHAKTGVYPLNFSFPQPHLMPQGFPERPHFLSSTIPGEPFSFENWEMYREEYQSSYFALSTKKGGWDTFRHLEILFSGGIPLMPRLAHASEFALAHYPKKALIRVLDSLMKDGLAIPDEHTQAFFRDYATDRLSSKAMARYLVDVAGLENSRVLFLDRALPARTDYLSAFTLIGLGQLMGNSVHPAYEPSYLYEDYAGDTTRLYGRGFGYTRTLTREPSAPQSLSHDAPVSSLVELSDAYDHIVVGNYDANRDLVADLRGAGVPAEKFVAIVGSDLPTDFRLRNGIRSSGMLFFVREFLWS